MISDRSETGALAQKEHDAEVVEDLLGFKQQTFGIPMFIGGIVRSICCISAAFSASLGASPVPDGGSTVLKT